MGCTSSTPNMIRSSTAEKSIQFEDEMSDDHSKDTEEIIYRAGKDTNEMTVLPSCDTLAEHIHVVRNRSTPSLETEKDIDEGSHFKEVINKSSSNDILHENVTKLEEVVDKVVELYTENVNELQLVSKTTGEVQNSQECIVKNNTEESNVTEENEEHGQVVDDNERVDHQAEEAISPSQSESSRATRWEALADIAAELPPSLTVDPITGQIYALSK